MSSFGLDIAVLLRGLSDAASTHHLWLLFLAILVASIFELVNGFHDTANAVATVIYTGALRPWKAVLLSGFCNFVGVFIGGIGVAMAIVKLLPADLISSGQTDVSLAMIFAMLISALAWNLATWYVGIPASSSHAMLGAILGIGLGHAFIQDHPLASGVNWSKVKDVGLALLISPLFGFVMSAMGVYFLRKFRPHSRLQHAPTSSEKPPLAIRATLIGTSAGVSFAHGSNDGQKGVGLIMLILIALLPHHFSINPAFLGSAQKISEVQNANRAIKEVIVSHIETSDDGQSRQADLGKARSHFFGDTAYASSQPLAPNLLPANAPEQSSGASVEIVSLSDKIDQLLERAKSHEGLTPEARHDLRVHILKLDSQMGKMGLLSDPSFLNLQAEEKKLVAATEYAPIWVLLLVALSLGVGTMIGWKRIVVTIGEKIGNSHLTFGQGMVSELVAMSTIAVSALLGVPVSTTHCLSSGIAGGMFASRSGIQRKTVRNILLAWVLTLPVTIFLSSALFVLLLKSAPFS